MVNVNQLELKRDKLKQELQRIGTAFKHEIKKDIQYYKDFTELYHNFDRDLDWQKIIFDCAISTINNIIDNNKQHVKACFEQVFSTQDVLYNLDDIVNTEYVLKILLGKITANQKTNIDNIEKIKYNELYVRININDRCIKFMTQNDILSEISLFFTNSSAKEHIEFLSKDFSFNIDINEMNFFSLSTKLNQIKDIILNKEFTNDELEIINSYMTHLKRGYVILFKKGCLKTSNCICYCESFIQKLNDSIFKKYSCKKKRGMLISFFYAISIGLLDIFKIDYYKDQVDMYYLVWVRHYQSGNNKLQ